MKPVICWLGILLHSITFAQPHAPDTLWTREYVVPGNQIVHAAASASDGGFLLVGASDPANTQHPQGQILRLDAEGEVLVDTLIGGTAGGELRSVAVVPGGGFIAAGFAADSTPGRYQVMLARVAESGRVLWRRDYLSPNDDIAECVRSTSDGGFVLCGSSNRSDGGNQIYVVKTNSVGDTVWTHFYRQPMPIIATDGYSIAESVTGGFIIAGNINGPFANGSYLMRIRDDGDTLWTQVRSSYRIVERTPSGAFALAGSGGTTTHPFLMRMDDQGTVQWSRQYGGQSWQDIFHFTQTLDNGYVLVGDDHAQSERPLFVMRTDSLGDSLWSAWYGTPGLGAAYSVLALPDGGLLIAGYVNQGTPGGDNVYVVRTASDFAGTAARGERPPGFALSQNYPNPFNEETQISLTLLQTSAVNLTVYDLLGRSVRTVYCGRLPGGTWRFTLRGDDIPSGVFWYRLQAGTHTVTRRLVHVK